MSQDKPSIPNEKLKNARLQRGWSQRHIAEQIKAPDSSMISDWERGKNRPSHHYQTKLCDLFAMNADELGFIEPVKQKGEKRRTPGETDNTIFQNFKMASPSTGSSPEQPFVFSTENVTQLPDQEAEYVCTHETHQTGKITPPFSHQASQPSRSWVRQTGLSIGLVLLISFVFVKAYLSLPSLRLPWQQEVPTPPTAPPSTIHQEQKKCTLDSNEAGYLKIFVRRDGKEEVLCFSGTGTLDTSIDNVQSVEVGNHQANWTYLSIKNEQHISPTSSNPDLYWCLGKKRIYPKLINIRKITIASSSSATKCTNEPPLA